MASSNHGDGGTMTEPPSAPHSSDMYHAAETSSPPPPATTSYPSQAAPPANTMYNYPPASSYPPVPGGHQHLHAYPQPQGYAPYTNAYPGAYQYPAALQYGPTPKYYSAPGNCRRFLRCFICCSCMILTTMALVGLIVVMTLRPALPVYKVTSMSVSNFSTAPSLTGHWDIGIRIENPNERIRAHFSVFRVYVVHNDGVVAVSEDVPGFAVNKHDPTEMHVRGTSNGDLFKKTALDTVGKERASGSVTLSLRIPSLVSFKSSHLSTRQLEVVAKCQGLVLVFSNNTASTGNLINGGRPVECLVFVV